MRVTVYDKNPGPGIGQWFLKVSWFLGCFIQKLFGKVDDYYGAKSWTDALTWLANREGELTSVQYWGHGSPGTVWLGGSMVSTSSLISSLKPKVTAASVVWFRTCSTFQGSRGYDFSKKLADGLGCTIAGHTRIIGLFQGGLHTRKPNSEPSWKLDEGELEGALARSGLKWGSNTIFCLTTKIPEGW